MIRIVPAFLLITLISINLIGPARAQDVVVLLPHSSEAYDIESVVPEGWTDAGQGIFTRQHDASDPTLIAQQSAPVSAAEVLTSLLPQLGLTDAPESTGTREGISLTWTLYKVDVEAVDLTVDLALAEDNGVTYIALLQTAPDEYATLHDSIFLPMLDAFAPLEMVEEAVPYNIEEVTFASGDLTLAGTLTLPPSSGPHPAVVLVSGSGPQDRDEALGGGIAIKPFRLLADALTRAGVAVLRYDDRGVGKSTGTFSEATTHDFATDAEAAIGYLLTRDEIDPEQIGLLGHSEGGVVAAMLGARNDDLDFIISLAGTGVNGRDVLLLQNQRIMEADGATQEQVDEQVAFARELIANVDDPETVEAIVYERTLAQVEALPEEERAQLGDLEQVARTTARQAAQQFNPIWFAPFLAYDPAPDWAQTTVPVLALFGGKDVQVDAQQNAPPMLAALAEAGNDDVELVVLPDANHLFQAADTGGFSEYATLPSEFTPDLLPTILDWLEGHVVTAEQAAATPVSATPVP